MSPTAQAPETVDIDLTARWGLSGPRTLRRLADGQDDRPYELFGVRPLGPLIGAEITGVDLGAPVTPELHAELNRALLEHKVVFFRRQRITNAQHRDFARLWGELETHPFLPQGDTADVVRFAKDADLSGYENIWHTDVTWRANPALGSVLRLTEVPPHGGGDTLWADAGAAYDNLPDDVKARIDGLTAVHDFMPSFGRFLPPELAAAKQAEFPPVAHPIVRTHPETGRKSLFVNAIFTTHIPDLPADEGEELLRYLFRQAFVPEYQVRWRWEKDDIAFWDNRATWHYASSDYHPHVRVAERASIVGDVPR
ncbi:TauD/TfdA dioxygenase family protein [Actinocorallia sp. A-T 12471]|uniref:TauD/TfdA dioxygenase family protein n=1 Tax=Actinocorallia sp. A-T 12471 TaxID=3089813 RepID=UPI0029CE69EA|nr:TauD/TfdA family dioxygenase [Actinocorallia sp. A-T 12471]MDX6739556.1 TauD/TfdA family dioxygenase [Actinocorallia sp. A-T 12471]